MKLDWLKNRLSVMEPGEVLFRFGRLISLRIEWVKYSCSLGSLSVPNLSRIQSILHDSNRIQDNIVDIPNKYTIDGVTKGKGTASVGKPIQLFFKHPPVFHSEINWSKDPKTGRVAPGSFGKLIDYRDDRLVGDIKYLWELGRHQFLVPLAIDVFCSGDKESEKKLSMYLQTWLDQNSVGQGIHWCSSLETALRLISWSFVHTILLSAGKKNGIFDLVSSRLALERSIFYQIKFTQSYYSRHSSANNHLIGELMGVWVSCNVFEFSEYTETWRDAAQSGLEREAKLQQHDDGVNREQAIYYHFWVLEYLLLAWLIGQRFNRPFSDAFVCTIGKMAGFLRNMCAENGGPPSIGDADGGQVVRFRHTISDNPYQELLQAIDTCTNTEAHLSLPYSKAFWYSRIISLEKEKAKLQKIQALAEFKSLPTQYLAGGYCLLGDNKMKVCLKAGNMGYLSTAAHGHADLLSLCLAVDDTWWLTDQGTYSYHSDSQWRDYFRGTAAHNTVQVDSDSQSEIGGAFLWLKKASASMSGFRGISEQSIKASINSTTTAGVNHSRFMEFEKMTKTLTICDNLTVDLPAKSAFIKSRFHFHPLVVLEKTSNHRYLAGIPGRKDRLDVQLPDCMTWEVIRGQTKPTIEGWYSDGYDLKVPSNVLVGTAEISSSREFHSSITLV